jgi:hypothetical protein
MNKITPAMKKKITSDWVSCLPEFFAFAPMRLGRLVGPLVQGVCLDRDPSNSAYLPTLHIHNLCKSFPVIALDLGQPLLVEGGRGVERISIESHSERYVSAAKRLVASSYLPTSGSISVRLLESAVDRYQKSGRPDANHPLSLLEDIVMCYAWLGLRDEAVTLCKKYVDITKKWPEYVFSRDGGRQSWVEKLLSYPDSEEQLRKIFAEQLVFHKLHELPVSDLTK